MRQQVAVAIGGRLLKMFRCISLVHKAFPKMEKASSWGRWSRCVRRVGEVKCLIPRPRRGVIAICNQRTRLLLRSYARNQGCAYRMPEAVITLSLTNGRSLPSSGAV